MNKILCRLVTVLLATTMFLAACGSAAQPTAEQPAASQPTTSSSQPTASSQEQQPQPTMAQTNKEPVNLGALLPLSEPGASQAGQLILRGIQLGAEYVNTEMGGSVDGRPVAVMVEDDKGTPEVGASGYRRLVQEKNVIGVTGGYHSSVVLAEIEVAKELGAPIIVTQASNADITASGYPQVFRTHLIDPVRAIALVDFAKNQGFQRVAYIADNTDFGVGLAAAVEAEAQKQGVDFKSMIYDKAAVDLTPELLELQAWKPDLLLNAGTGTPEHLIIDQAYDIGLYPDVPMLATSDWPYRSDEYWSLHGNKGIGIYILTSYHKDMQLTDRGQWFYDQYTKQFGEPPTYSSYNGFGDAVILAEAAKRAGTTDYAAIVKELASDSFDFWAGTVSFPAGEGPFWHQWTPPVLITQYTAANQTQQDAKLIYTFNYSP